MLAKVVSLFLIGMLVLGMFGKLRYPGQKRLQAAKCPKCGRFRFSSSKCDHCIGKSS